MTLAVTLVLLILLAAGADILSPDALLAGFSDPGLIALPLQRLRPRRPADDRRGDHRLPRLRRPLRRPDPHLDKVVPCASR